MNIVKAYESNTLDMHTFALWVVNGVAQSIHHSFNDKSRGSAILNFHNMMVDYLKEKIDFNNLTLQDMRALGFRQWDEEDDLMLIPLYLYSALPEGLEVTTIEGKKCIVGKDPLDTDSRYQALSFGLYPKNKEEEHK